VSCFIAHNGAISRLVSELTDNAITDW